MKIDPWILILNRDAVDFDALFNDILSERTDPVPYVSSLSEDLHYMRGKQC